MNLKVLWVAARALIGNAVARVLGGCQCVLCGFQGFSMFVCFFGGWG